MQVKVLTLNIWNGGVFFENIIAFLKKEQPDILLLQEVYEGYGDRKRLQERSYALLKKELGYPHSAFAPEFFDTRAEVNVDCGNAIFSRFPLFPHHPVFFMSNYRAIDEASDVKRFPRNILRADIELGEKLLSVFVTHGIWGTDNKSTPERLVMSSAIQNEVLKTDYAILGGDFNCDQNSRTIRPIAKYLKNVLKGELKTSFNMKHKKQSGYGRSVVDMLFITPNIQVVNHYCPQVDVSDHLPLVAVLEV